MTTPRPTTAAILGALFVLAVWVWVIGDLALQLWWLSSP
jgi:hypothetical protein